MESVIYDVCQDCSKYGERVEVVKPKKKYQRRHDERILVKNYAERLRTARESQTQKDFAKRLSLKESEIHAFESGSRAPTIQTAAELERKLHISLLEVPENQELSAPSGSQGGALTIADLLKKN